MRRILFSFAAVAATALVVGSLGLVLLGTAVKRHDVVLTRTVEQFAGARAAAEASQLGARNVHAFLGALMRSRQQPGRRPRMVSSN